LTETHKLLVTLAVTVLGSGIGTTIVGALFKRRFDNQLEVQKALLQRGSRIHERQVDALLAIHTNLEKTLFYLQRAASPARFQGESTEKLLQGMVKALSQASEDFSQNKLLLSKELTTKLDQFFEETFFARLKLDHAEDPMTPDGRVRADFFDEARERAFKKLPLMLEAIRTEARRVIHS
jgi:hypothetical protein